MVFFHADDFTWTVLNNDEVSNFHILCLFAICNQLHTSAGQFSNRNETQQLLRAAIANQHLTCLMIFWRM